MPTKKGLPEGKVLRWYFSATKGSLDFIANHQVSEVGLPVLHDLPDAIQGMMTAQAASIMDNGYNEAEESEGGNKFVTIVWEGQTFWSIVDCYGDLTIDGTPSTSNEWTYVQTLLLPEEY